MNEESVTFELGKNKIKFSTGKFAKQATGAVLTEIDDNTILTTATISDEKKDMSYFPLSCDFEEKFYSTGKIKGSRFIKREGRPSDDAILTSRLIDRPIRPLFSKDTRNSVQIIATPFCLDKKISPASFCISSASAALMISGVEFDGPVSSIRVGMIDDNFIINPNYEEIEKSDLDLVVAGTNDAITMVEANAKEVNEEKFLESLAFAHESIKKICDAQIELKKKIAPNVIKLGTKEKNENAVTMINGFDFEKVHGKTKHEVKENIHQIQDKLLEKCDDDIKEEKYTKSEIMDLLQKKIDSKMRDDILENGNRIDGRKEDEIRKILCEVSLFKRNHGTGFFQRGETQALTFATLGAPGDAQIIDSPDKDYEKKYIHYYCFPPYSVGEARPLRGVSRREIGHGALAERALMPVLPSKEDFPYTILLMSEILSCNGSSSMASVCGSTLSLMDAGVKISSPVSGIAMGLVMNEETGKYRILSDIQGFEDFAGDMDFKVCGTEKGITAIQMDIKVKGLTIDLLKDAFTKAKIGRMEILKKMLEAIDKPRENLSDYAPRIISMQIEQDKIRTLIGPGGETINKIIDACNVKIDIADDGFTTITAEDGEGGEKAKKMVEAIVKDVKVGEILHGKVVKILDFGAIFEYAPGKDGMVHISELANHRVNKVDDIVKVGDAVKVKCIGKDDKGRFKFSMKACK